MISVAHLDTRFVVDTGRTPILKAKQIKNCPRNVLFL